MEALARAKERREAAQAAQAARMTAEKAAIAKAHEDAKEHGLVEKTAGESGAAGNLRNNWVKWLASEHGGCPVLEGTKWAANLWVWNGRRYGV